MKFFILLFSVAMLSAKASHNVIILLDQTSIENIGSPHYRYLMNKLQSALEEKAAPLLISTSLWENFLIKRMSIVQRTPGSLEEKVFSTYELINERLNSTFQQLQQQGFDPIQSKQWMLTCVNQEFYGPDSSYVVDWTYNTTFVCYLTRFYSADWKGYLHPSGQLLLLIPKGIDGGGFQLEHLQAVEDHLEDPAYFYLCNSEKGLSSADHLLSFFTPKSGPWNIFLSGHGGTYYEESPSLQAYAMLADLSLAGFQKWIRFCDEEISTRCLYYATCYGSGNHMRLAFAENLYSYAIISGCLGDTMSWAFPHLYPLPDRKGSELKSSHISYDAKSGWALTYDYRYRWKDFFANLTNHSFVESSLDWLKTTFELVSPSYLSCTHRVRLPQASHFITVLPDACLQITDQLIHWKKEEGMIQSSRNTQTVLLETSTILSNLVLQNEQKVPNILSLLPGESSHYIQKLTLKTNQDLLSAFWPTESALFQREFLVDEICFPSKDFSLLPNYKEKEVTLKHLWVIVDRSSMRIFFQTKNGDAFMLVTNKEDLFPERISGQVKGLYPLSSDRAKDYLDKYFLAKSRCLNN